MGVSLAWVAANGLAANDMLSRLSLGATAKSCNYPFSGIAAHALPNSWFLVIAGGCDHRITNAASMAVLSKGCRAIACSIEEHVNFASAEFWDNGLCVWKVQHQGEEGDENISAKGQLPQRFNDLLATVEGVDSENLDGHFHMDIPLILAKEIAGYRHDDASPELDRTPFQELVDLAAKPWWKLWK